MPSTGGPNFEKLWKRPEMEAPNWTKEEFIAYLLLYAANSDFKESNKERNMIISRVDHKTFQRIHSEFSEDNDYQSIQKIMAALEQHNYSKQDLESFHADLKLMFHSDGSYDLLEKNMFTFLKRLFE